MTSQSPPVNAFVAPHRFEMVLTMQWSDLKSLLGMPRLFRRLLQGRPLMTSYYDALLPRAGGTHG